MLMYVGIARMSWHGDIQSEPIKVRGLGGHVTCLFAVEILVGFVGHVRQVSRSFSSFFPLANPARFIGTFFVRRAATRSQYILAGVSPLDSSRNFVVSLYQKARHISSETPWVRAWECENTTRNRAEWRRRTHGHVWAYESVFEKAI